MKSYGEVQTKELGILKKDQMYWPDSDQWLISRISPNCENRCVIEHSKIITTYIELALFEIQQVYKIVCPECGETVELENEEFKLIKSFIKINNMLQSGKIGEIEYKYRLEEINAKIKKTKRVK